jgi:phage tail-like protein
MAAEPDEQKDVHPFSAFAFAVEIHIPNITTKACSAAFSECDGLEITMDVKTIREGGNNGRQIRLTGPLSFAQLTLKRGMTSSFDLWDWFNAVVTQPSLRASAEVVVFKPSRPDSPDQREESVRFILTRCLPVKLKAPPLNAKDGIIAIEELQIAYETLALKRPEPAQGKAQTEGG